MQAVVRDGTIRYVHHASQSGVRIVAAPAVAAAMLVAAVVLWSGCSGLSDTEKLRLAQEHYDAAVRLQGSGQVEEAIAEYDDAIELDPRYAEAYYWRGAAQLGLGNLEASVSDHATAIFINPRYARATLLLPYEDALKRQDEALRQDPEDAAAYAARALTNAILGREEASLEDVSKAELLGHDPGSLRALVKELAGLRVKRE